MEGNVEVEVEVEVMETEGRDPEEGPLVLYREAGVCVGCMVKTSEKTEKEDPLLIELHLPSSPLLPSNIEDLILQRIYPPILSIIIGAERTKVTVTFKLFTLSPTSLSSLLHSLLSSFSFASLLSGTTLRDVSSSSTITTGTSSKSTLLVAIHLHSLKISQVFIDGVPEEENASVAQSIRDGVKKAVEKGEWIKEWVREWVKTTS